MLQVYKPHKGLKPYKTPADYKPWVDFKPPVAAKASVTYFFPDPVEPFPTDASRVTCYVNVGFNGHGNEFIGPLGEAPNCKYTINVQCVTPPINETYGPYILDGTITQHVAVAPDVDFTLLVIVHDQAGVLLDGPEAIATGTAPSLPP